MINPRLQSTEETLKSGVPKRVLAAVAQEFESNEVDDTVRDGMDIYNIIDNHHSSQRYQNVTSNDLQSLGETIRNTLLEINEIREQNRERRHKELLNVLKKIAQHNCGTAKCEDDKTNITTACTEDECLNNTIDGNINNLVDVENKQTKPLNDSNKTSERKDSTTVQKQDINYIENEQIPESLNFLDERTIQECEDPPSQSVTQEGSTIKACSVILGRRHITTVNRMPAAKQNTKLELQQMRSKMLELQRKKMEDRLRKKRQIQLPTQEENS